VEKGKKSEIPICHMGAVGDLVGDDSDLPRPAMQLVITRVRISQLVAERDNGVLCESYDICSENFI
jgi:hypothetical protein